MGGEDAAVSLDLREVMSGHLRTLQDPRQSGKAVPLGNQSSRAEMRARKQKKCPRQRTALGIKGQTSARVPGDSQEKPQGRVPGGSRPSLGTLVCQLGAEPTHRLP